jgi:hypothetical protein
LGFAWQYELESISGLEATPIVVDGVMFANGPWGAAYAVDAKTGEGLWSFKPEIDVTQLGKVCCGQVNRGVAVWQSHVYVASIDGYLYALDAGSGNELWKVDTITERERGYTITGAPYIVNNVVASGNSGGVMSSGGDLVFQGRASGVLFVYNARTGKQLHRIDTGTSIQAAPITYSIDGEQYVAVMVGLGNYHAPEIGVGLDGSIGRIIAFKLGGGVVPKPAKKSQEEQAHEKASKLVTEPPLPRQGTRSEYEQGRLIYVRSCSACHNNSAPDLRSMTVKTHSEFFEIVVEGKRVEKGMANFSHMLTPEDAESLHGYLIDIA